MCAEFLSTALNRYLAVTLSMAILTGAVTGCSVWSYLTEQQSSIPPDSAGVAWVACR